MFFASDTFKLIDFKSISDILSGTMARPEAWSQDGSQVTQEYLDHMAVEGPLHIMLESLEPDERGHFPLKGGGFITSEDVRIWMGVPKIVHDVIHIHAFRLTKAVSGQIDDRATFLTELAMLKLLIEFSQPNEEQSEDNGQ